MKTIKVMCSICKKETEIPNHHDTFMCTRCNNINKIDNLDELTSTDTSTNNGGSTSYYDFPEGCKNIQDVIIKTNIPWNIANIFKASYRYGKQDHSEAERDLNKIIWFAQDELKRIKEP